MRIRTQTLLCGLACWAACILPAAAQVGDGIQFTVTDDGTESVDSAASDHSMLGDSTLGNFDFAAHCPTCRTNSPTASVPQKAEFPTVKLSGFFQADAGWVHQDQLNRLTVGDIQDGADFRRARLAAIGNVASNVDYMVEFDFAFPGRPSFMDVWLNISDLPALQNVKVGQYRQPIGLDGLTSVKELTFIERGLPFAFLPFRQIGIMSFGTTLNDKATWALSGLRFPTDAFGGQIGDNGGYGLASRITRIFGNENSGIIHVGAAYSVIDPANNAIQYRSQPEFFLAETGGAAFVPTGVPTVVPPFVDTGVLAAELVQLFGSELATSTGPFHTQSELIFARVDRSGRDTTTFAGASAQFGFILTGEHRPYNSNQGILGRIVPNNPYGQDGNGAWEIAGRWSWLDLNDADVRGGKLTNATVGLNWYLNKYAKFQLNYVHAMLDSPSNGDSDANIVAARAHLDF